ncbi:MAG: type II CRISPR-associated endonuclease Cas1 [Edaphocola sp.]
MIKRTLYFGNPAYLKTQNEQLHISRGKDMDDVTVPIEDVGVLILDHNQITITQPLMAKLLANNVALITCDHTHHPVGLMLNLDGHTLQSQKFKEQIAATQPLKKQLWQQTIEAKIRNQAAVLAALGKAPKPLHTLGQTVKSGDSANNEAKAATYYWRNLFEPELDFRRERYGPAPNNLLNYGYAILRAVVARSLVASGLLPTLGIFHRNQYNAYCLADDIMEPYRPYVDLLIVRSREGAFPAELDTHHKRLLLGIPAMDVTIDGRQSPLMNAVQRTTASLSKCYEGEQRKILYPQM